MVAHGKLLDYKKTYLSDDNNHAPHASKDVSDSHRDVSSDPIDCPDIPADPVKRCLKHPKYEMDKCCVKCAVVTCLECAFNDHKAQTCDVIPLEDIPKILKTLQGHVDDAWQSFVQLRDSVTNMYKEQKQLQDNVRDLIREEIESTAEEAIKKIKTNQDSLLQAVCEQGTTESLAFDSKMKKMKDEYTTLKEQKIANMNREFEDLDKLQKVNDTLEKINGVSARFGRMLSLEDKQIDFSSTKVENDGTFCKVTNGKLVGGVMIKKNQCVHLLDQRLQGKGVLFTCFDPNDSKKEYWKYLYPIKDQRYPIVLSNRAMYHDNHFRLLFAAGRTAYFVDFIPSREGLYEGVKNVELVEINAVVTGSWITSIYAHHNTNHYRSEFIISLSGCNVLHRCNLVHKGAFAEINISPLISATHRSLNSITYNETMFAIVIQGSNEVIMFTNDGIIKRCGTLSPPAGPTVLKPVSVFWTGARWLVIWMSTETKGSWLVMMYKPKEDRMEEVYRGVVTSILDVPVSITNSERNVVVSLANTSTVIFKF
ncbi:hypothetical protein BSL78_08268 [Apostichopus japonicus]|uniref:B box-type domain-containing protein n=1 Tax=Stichopus japonicus TaxID=307972 RepID=A0A2G8L3J5_STIJA|nr:hypothetical protein BSL78_08268 [Apostichopus japonicus]